MKKLVAFSLVACLALAVSVSAEEKKTTDRSSETGALSDEQFVKQVSAAGLAEGNLSRLAMTRASRADVRRFADRMVADHSKANTELLQLANRKGWALAERMDKAHQDAFERMSAQSGADFDRAYMNQMVQDHEAAVALFDRESKNGKDADLKNWASTTLPTLRDHLKMARDTAGTTSGTARPVGTDRPSTDRPGTDRPTTDRPGVDRPGTDRPKTPPPSVDRPGTDRPGTTPPRSDTPKPDRPGTKSPTTGDSPTQPQRQQTEPPDR